jgi:hypothetical protein
MKPKGCACYGSNDIHQCFCNLKNNNMKQETLEEAMDKSGYHNEVNDSMWREGVKFGAKWQQEDMIEELEMHILINEDDWNRNPHTQLKDFINSLNKQDQYETKR